MIRTETVAWITRMISCASRSRRRFNAKNTLVIPILLDGSRIPKADQLPEDLKELSLRNSLDVRHASFHDDMEKLIRWLKEEQGPTPKQMTLARIIARLLVLLLGIAILYLLDWCSQPRG